MKRFKYASLFFVVSLVFIGVFLLFPDRASAAAPECFKDETPLSQNAEPFASVPCDDTRITLFLGLGSNPTELKDDHCYMVTGISLTGGIVEEATADSAKCNEWRTKANDQSNIVGRPCWRAEITYDEYAALEDEPGDFVPVDCASVPPSEFDSDLQPLALPGYCTIFFNSTKEEGKVYWYEARCDIIAAHVLAPSTGNTSIPTSADRDAIADCDGRTDPESCLNDNPIVQLTYWAINILSGLAGLAIVGMIVAGGIQYSTAGASPQAVSAAKGKIINALIALLALFFLYAFLQWLVPGGIF